MGILKLKENDAKQILIIDDEKAVTDTYEEFLVDSSYSIQITNSPQNAWQKLEKQSFDLIITDLHMPHLGGEELLKIIRKNEKHRGVPVIIASGNCNKLHESQAKRDPSLHLIKKPFQKEEFLKKIVSILK